MYQLYYQPEGIWVGDIMPYGKEGQFLWYIIREIQEIQDLFGEPFGWALATTKDFCRLQRLWRKLNAWNG